MDAVRAPKQPVWEKIQAEDPDVVMLLGDQIYMDWGDLGESNWKQFIEAHPGGTGKKVKGLQVYAEEMHSRYQRQWQVKEFQEFISLKRLAPDSENVARFVSNEVS